MTQNRSAAAQLFTKCLRAIDWIVIGDVGSVEPVFSDNADGGGDAAVGVEA